MSSYGEGLGTRARRFLSETFGFRGSRNVAAWLVAGAGAYYLFYMPERQRVLEVEVSRQAAKQKAMDAGIAQIEAQQQQRKQQQQPPQQA